MGAGVNKVYLSVRGRDILDYSVETTVACESVSDLVLVHRAEDAGRIERVVAEVGESRLGVTVRAILGGETRHDSEYAGVAALRSEIEAGELDVVAVHDGARPFMSADLLHRLLVGAADRGAVIPGLAVTDTLYALDRRRFVDSTDHVWVQTPQVFDARTLLHAHDAAAAAGFQGVDTAEVVNRFSDLDVGVIEGEHANIKITYGTDLAAAEVLAADWEGARPDEGA